jgi:hypothetical protein
MLLGVYRSCSFLRKATMLLLKSGHEVGNPYSCPGCHAERSEASLCPSRQMLRCAQHDIRGQQPDPWLRGGVTSSLFAALTAVLDDLLRTLISKYLNKLFST